MQNFLINTLIAFIGINILALPLLFSSPAIFPNNRQDLLNHLQTTAAIALILAMLAT